jgi:hypothetical protein
MARKTVKWRQNAAGAWDGTDTAGGAYTIRPTHDATYRRRYRLTVPDYKLGDPPSLAVAESRTYAVDYLFETVAEAKKSAKDYAE